MEPSSAFHLFAVLGAAAFFGVATGFIHTTSGVRKDLNPVPGAGSILEVLKALRAAPVPLGLVITLATLSILVVALGADLPLLVIVAAVYALAACLSFNRSWILGKTDGYPINVGAEAIEYGLRNFDRFDADRDGLILASDLQWHLRHDKLSADETCLVRFLAAHFDTIGRLLGSHVAEIAEPHRSYRLAPAIRHLSASPEKISLSTWPGRKQPALSRCVDRKGHLASVFAVNSLKHPGVTPADERV